MNYILILETNDPYFNIATEEYLLKNFSDNFLFIYRNETSVIVGKHQNVFAEVNLMDVWKQNIPIVRRITGGGTVYHDLGNMNFSFVETGEKGKLIDFKKYLTPVIGFLKTIGIDAVIGEKNELKVGGAKVSGNAEHVYRNRLVHHGTLLFDANLNKLRSILNPSSANYVDFSVKSNRSKVANIKPLLKERMTIEDFIAEFVSFYKDAFDYSTSFKLQLGDRKTIQKLKSSKYLTWEWNFGYSPDFTIEKEVVVSNGVLNFKADVKKGVMTAVNIRANSEEMSEISRILQDNLEETTFMPDSISYQLNEVSKGLPENFTDDFIKELFG